MLQTAERGRIQLDPQHELERIIPLRDAAQLLGISTWSLKRQYRDKIIQVAPRHLGMRIKDALLLAEPLK